MNYIKTTAQISINQLIFFKVYAFWLKIQILTIIIEIVSMADFTLSRPDLCKLSSSLDHTLQMMHTDTMLRWQNRRDQRDIQKLLTDIRYSSFVTYYHCFDVSFDKVQHT